MNDLVVPEQPDDSVVLHQDLQRFEHLLLARLADAGLPTQGVLVELEEREQALHNLGTALRRLPTTERGRSYYVSKMIAAAGAGLFDAALNYLWNETVGELRRRVAAYDLAYFYEIAVPSPDRRKHLATEADLAKVDDVDLLRASLQIGLLSQTGHAQLDHIRYMRNWASAAHPNHVEITGLLLAAWLETCIRQVITLPYDTITAETKRLLINVKEQVIDQTAAASTAAFFENLPPDRADAIGAGLFGLYVDPTQPPRVADNVRNLWPLLWPYVSEEAREAFGLRFGRFTASGDAAQATSASELLDLVGGAAYLPERERAVEIDAAVDALLAAHHGWNNFHTEPAPARALSGLVGERGEVPTSVRSKYLRALVEVWLGNTSGVSWAAKDVYESLLQRLETRDAALVLRAFMVPTIAVKLWSDVGQKQWTEFLDIIEPKLTSPADRALAAAVRSFSSTPDKLSSDATIRKLVNEARVSGAARPAARTSKDDRN